MSGTTTLLGLITNADADNLHTALTTNYNATLAILDNAVTLAGSQTLTNKTLTSPTIGTQLNFSDAASRIVPGATSLSMRNNANNADNFIITDAGVATVRAGLAVAAGNVKIGSPTGALTGLGANDPVMADGIVLRYAHSNGNAYPILSGDSTFNVQIGGGYSGSQLVHFPGQATASYPGGGANLNGIIGLDTTTNQLVFYVGGNRYHVTGTSF